MVCRSFSVAVAALAFMNAGCVPSGKAPPWDAGASKKAAVDPGAFEPSADLMTEPFRDDFTRDGAAIGDDWSVLDTKAWRIENGRVKTPDGFKDAWNKLTKVLEQSDLFDLGRRTRPLFVVQGTVSALVTLDVNSPSVTALTHVVGKLLLALQPSNCLSVSKPGCRPSVFKRCCVLRHERSKPRKIF
jgi:hypothetical protein